VHTNYRQKGIARNLIRHIEKIGIGENATQVKLHTVKETGNVDVFRRLGFTVVAEQEDDLFESEKFERLTDVEMIMQLSIN
jgi:ribosomal protein S18 acetylase RimI-like enzyme